ncbi:MAG: deoxynucleoside kinase [Gammaproteobacteria bacterium]|nr:deoxynucleoside kinase [Gammaproteobacteria bacterium]
MTNPAQHSIAIESTAALAQKLDGHDVPRYIAVEGPIGVGKTTLANKLAELFRYPMLLEPAAENPFLDRYYREGRRHALPTQLFFLLHRAQQIENIDANDLLGPTLVADFLIEKDDLFARMTLDDNEYQLYQQIHDSLNINPPTPDLVIYLQAPVSVLRNRIRERGIAYERDIESGYLDNLASAYTEFFHFYDAAPMLVVNAAAIDFANNADHFEALLDQILAMDGLRQYFNPNPTIL